MTTDSPANASWHRPEGSTKQPASQVPRGFVLLLTLIFSLACAAPYLWAWSVVPEGTRFTGIILNHFDQNYYQAAQRSAAEDLVQQNRFTSEPGAPGPVAPLYALMGEVKQRTGLPAMVAYHFPRLLAVLALPSVLTWLYSLCFPGRRRLVMWSVVLALFAAGVGTFVPWLPGADRSSEWVAESNVFRSLSVYPHFAGAHIGLALAYGAALMALRGRPVLNVALVSVGAGACISVTHPFLLLPVAMVLGCLALIVLISELRARAGLARTARLLATGLLVLPSLPVLVTLRQELRMLEQANGTPFPAMLADSWWTWAYAFGLLSPLALAGVVVSARHRWGAGLGLMFLWAFAQLFLVFSSVTPFQRRYVEGLAIPLAAFGAIGLCHLHRTLSEMRLIQCVVATVLVGGTIVSLRLLGQTGQYHDASYRALWPAVDRRDVVLAGHGVASQLPAYTSGTAYLARPVETIRSETKRLERRRYVRNPTGRASLRWLREAGITLVVVEEGDPTFGPVRLEQLPPSATCLDPVLRQASLRAYRVSTSCIAQRLSEPAPRRITQP